MKAFLLAGGRGERLRPLTLTMPKCLVPINGVPLLAYWLALFERQGVTHVLVNVSQHAEQVRDFLSGWRGGADVTLVIEDLPRGNAGTVAANRSFVQGEESFWIFYADNLTDVSLDDMMATHRAHPGVATLGLFRAPVPTAAGIVEQDASGRIIGFDEKPARPRSNLANAGIYLARQALLDRIPTGSPIVDFGYHVFPSLTRDLYGHVIEQFVMDVGTPEALAHAAEAWTRYAHPSNPG